MEIFRVSVEITNSLTKGYFQLYELALVPQFAAFIKRMTFSHTSTNAVEDRKKIRFNSPFNKFVKCC